MEQVYVNTDYAENHALPVQIECVATITVKSTIFDIFVDQLAKS